MSMRYVSPFANACTISRPNKGFSKDRNKGVARIPKTGIDAETL
jgi:hypothetical protein